MPDPWLLTVAGTDPTLGAGVTADMAVFHDFGCRASFIPSALVDQDSLAVHALIPSAPDWLRAALERQIRETLPAAIKVGLLATGVNARVVGETIAAYAGSTRVVLDPVLASGRGTPMADAELLVALSTYLLPHTSVLTPNIPEAEVMTGGPIADLKSAEHAARRLRDLGPDAVLLKGGHLADAPGDIWCDARGVRTLLNETQFSEDVHGTGCHLSSALAALLALGWPAPEAAVGARAYLRRCMTTLSRAPFEGDAGRPIVRHGAATVDAAQAVLAGRPELCETKGQRGR